MSNLVPTVQIAARTRKVSITNAASNIFAASTVAPLVPYESNYRPISGFVLQNHSANDWYFGYDNSITVAGGVNPGMKLGAGEVMSRQISGAVLQSTGLWVISTAAGPDTGTVEEVI